MLALERRLPGEVIDRDDIREIEEDDLDLAAGLHPDEEVESVAIERAAVDRLPDCTTWPFSTPERWRATESLSSLGLRWMLLWPASLRDHRAHGVFAAYGEY